MSVSVAMVRPLASFLSELGEDGAAFLTAAGIDAATPADALVPAEGIDTALAAIAAKRGDPAFGLTIGRAVSMRPFGVFGHVVWLSGTLRDALERAAKFFGAISRRTTVSVEVAGDLACVRQVSLEPRGAILTELPFASLALRARAATAGAFAVSAVRFAHAGDASHAAYRDVFGARVTFEAPANELEFPAAQLELPLASADPITRAVLEPTVAQLAATEVPFLDRVRRAAKETDDPEVIAKNLGMSARTLRRHLADEGTSLSDILDGILRDRADDMLARGTSVKEVAFALGFSEPSAFSRAYKRWTGRPPRS